MMRKIIVLIISVMLFTACHGMQRRLNDDSAISFVKKIRAAQIEFEKRHGKKKYGSLKDLINENLLSSELADGVEDGYEFRLNVENEKYSLQAVPLNYGTENSEGNFTLYLDESGVIRSASKKGIDIATWETANSNSIPISEQ